MKRIDSERLKKIQVKILDEIDEICRDNDIKYSLCAGTLLGAVRHKGFIPWDDDIDIMMPRPDYDKFIEYCKNHKTHFGMMSCETHKGFSDMIAKAYDPETKVVENTRSSKKFNVGVWVDIFPVDGIGNTHEEALKNFKATAFLRALMTARNWVRFEKSASRSWYVEPVRFVFFLLSRFARADFIISAIEKKYRNLTFETQEFAGCLAGTYRAKEILPVDVFKSFCKMRFENSEYPCIERYHEYLSSIYGDYMELSPEKERHSHHNFKAYYKKTVEEK